MTPNLRRTKGETPAGNEWIPLLMLHDVMNNVRKRPRECLSREGRHLNGAIQNILTVPFVFLKCCLIYIEIITIEI